MSYYVQVYQAKGYWTVLRDEKHIPISFDNEEDALVLSLDYPRSRLIKSENLETTIIDYGTGL